MGSIDYPETPDVPMLRRVLAHIETQDQLPQEECRWEQRAWRVERDCGTAMCFAGWAVELDPDAEWATDDPYDYRDSYHTVRVSDGTTSYVPAWAESRLGLDSAQANALFQTTNTLADLRRIVDALEADADWNPYD